MDPDSLKLLIGSSGFVDSYWLWSGATGNDLTISSLAVDEANNYDIYLSASSAGAEIALIKLDKDGGFVWCRLLTGAGTDSGLGVAVDASGNAIIAGHTNSEGFGSNDTVISKFDSSANQLWQRRIGGANSDTTQYNCVATDNSDNIYLAFTTGTDGGTICKYNSSGVLQWQRNSGSSTRAAYGISVDGSGNVYGCGVENQSPGGMYIVKYNSSGVVQWERKFSDTGLNLAGARAVTDASGNVYAVGRDTLANDAFLVKVSDGGTVIWQKWLTNSGIDRFNDVALDPYGRIFVVGAIGSKAVVARYGADGTLEWINEMENVNTNQLWTVRADANGTVYVGGLLNNNNWLVGKIPPNGTGTGSYLLEFRGQVDYFSISIGSLTQPSTTAVLSTLSSTEQAGSLSEEAATLGLTTPTVASDLQVL